ncbi:hypothetical protein AOQ84DRAFT_364351 [Glonium stellatum]|uniref:Uncharacterized protein n=1 Tax=Glonium stellatum TaxID=574774 RepID=A0A8E2F070_9PEZI|nr:hypothetical protein AOQ84DRAFT_364351 [Glonium stellatum]
MNPRKYSSYTEARIAQYNITTILIDPYTPMHAYSPILLIKSLTLPNWTVQKAFSRMTAFFRLGPSLLSKDVPIAYNEGKPVNASYWLDTQDVSNPISTDLVPAPATRARTTTGAAPAIVSAPLPIRLPISSKKGL